MSEHLIPSRRGRPGNDPIFALNKQAAERKAAGHPVINATLGALQDDDGKLATLSTATRAISEVKPEQWAAYAPIAGPPAFLGAVMDEMLAKFPDLRKRAVAVATPGGTGALRHAFTSFVEHGQSILTTSFFWGPYSTLAQEHGRSVRTFSMFDDNGALDTAALDVELGIAFKVQERAVVVLNDPCHNPTGYSLSDDDWERVRQVLARRSEQGPITVVLDIAYSAFSEGSLERPLKALASLSDRVMLAFCWSASKTFLEYGLRVGALVVVPPNANDSADVEAALTFACRGTWSNCNHGGLQAITRLLTDPEMRAKVDDERRVVTKLLGDRVDAWNQHATRVALKYPRYSGGFFVTVFCDDAPAAAALLREKSVFVVPQTGALRVALCSTATRDVERLVREVAEAVSATNETNVKNDAKHTNEKAEV